MTFTKPDPEAGPREVRVAAFFLAFALDLIP